MYLGSISFVLVEFCFFCYRNNIAMTSNFSTLVNSLLPSFIKGYWVKSSADKSCHPHLFISKTSSCVIKDLRLSVVGNVGSSIQGPYLIYQ